MLCVLQTVIAGKLLAPTSSALENRNWVPLGLLLYLPTQVKATQKVNEKHAKNIMK